MTLKELRKEVLDRLERHWTLDVIAHQLHVPFELVEKLAKKA